MLRGLFFAIKIGLFAAAAFWVAQRPGTVELDWMGYHIKAHVGLVLLALFVLLLFTLFLHRIAIAIAELPKKWGKRREKMIHEKGYRSLSQGLTAVAAGDTQQASDKARRTREYWPDDKGLSLLLEAQAARLRGEEDIARACFDKLLKNKDTAFLGLRGQLVNAMETGNTARALELAQQAEKMHPRQKWIIRMHYDLALQEHDWEQAEQALKKAVKFGAVEVKQAESDKIAIWIARADSELTKNNDRQALKWLKKAHGADRSFVPAAMRLAQYYIGKNKKNLARPVLQEVWKNNPHRALVPLWDSVMPENKKEDGGQAKLRWFEKLVALHPESAEAQLATAKVAINHELWGEARQYLEMAEKLGASARLYRTFAKFEEELGHTEEANDLFEKAADAPADKVWVCKQTGRIYESWSPIAAPHGAFNSIIWDYPQTARMATVLESLPQNELLITAK